MVLVAKHPERSHLIFRIRQISRNIEANAGLDDLDLSTRALLYYIGESVEDGRKLRVSDVVSGAGLGTAPTVYARLAELENAGWIQAKPDPDDGRARLVSLSPRALRVFQKISAKIGKLLDSFVD